MITDYDDKTIHMFVDMGVIESDSYRYEMLLHRRKGAEVPGRRVLTQSATLKIWTDFIHGSEQLYLSMDCNMYMRTK